MSKVALCLMSTTLVLRVKMKSSLGWLMTAGNAKQNACPALRCGGKVFDAERIAMDFGHYHKKCFSCAECTRVSLETFQIIAQQKEFQRFKPSLLLDAGRWHCHRNAGPTSCLPGLLCKAARAPGPRFYFPYELNTFDDQQVTTLDSESSQRTDTIVPTDGSGCPK